MTSIFPHTILSFGFRELALQHISHTDYFYNTFMLLVSSLSASVHHEHYSFVFHRGKSEGVAMTHYYIKMTISNCFQLKDDLLAFKLFTEGP